eukprot:Em0328g4a
MVDSVLKSFEISLEALEEISSLLRKDFDKEIKDREISQLDKKLKIDDKTKQSTQEELFDFVAQALCEFEKEHNITESLPSASLSPSLCTRPVSSPAPSTSGPRASLQPGQWGRMSPRCCRQP